MSIKPKIRKCKEDVNIFVQRRKKIGLDLIKKYGENTVLIVGSGPEQIRNDDVGYSFRQDSNLYYLTGFEEPGSVLILRPGKNPETVMFVREKNSERETWDGFRFGPEGVKSEFDIDAAYTNDTFEAKTVELLKGCENVIYRFYKYEPLDKMMTDVLKKYEATYSRSGYGVPSIHDADIYLGEFRLFKDENDLKNQRQACEITAQGHVAAMKATKPGLTEYQIQAVIMSSFFQQGSTREGYNYIVASGDNATTLHYNFNDQICEDGELVLIDAGAEYNYFSGDITRTFPVNGKFSDTQKKVYQAVLDVQKDVIAMIRPGLTFKSLQEFTIDRLTQVMLDLSLVMGRKEDVIKTMEYKKYYPHGVSHWLGMDVHDAGLYAFKGESRQLEPGMVFTVEPGLYIPYNDKTAPKELRGIGIRIEDNILITKDGCEILTASVPKEIKDIENLMQS